MKESITNLETVATLAKHRGFVFPGSAIYGGLQNSWDYGPLGTLLKNNIRDAWWHHFVQTRSDMVGLDAALLMNPKVWQASGHVDNFTDPLVEDKVTHQRYRADHLLEEATGETAEGLSIDELAQALQKNNVTSPDGNELSEPKQFNLLFTTSLGSVEGKKQEVYLRGELAQSMFVDFKRVLESMRQRIPFGIAQVGKVFRNEITPGNFTFRTLEFDLMEFEYFIKEKDWEKQFDYWLEDMEKWVTGDIGLNPDNLRRRENDKKELSHYSKRTVDLEYQTSFGWKELFGIAYRTDFDLKSHAEASGEDLQVQDPDTGDKYFPHVIEPTFGLTRLTLMVLLDAYHEEEVKGEKRVVLKIKPNLAPYQAAVLPLSKKPELTKICEPLVKELKKSFSCDYDITQSIGKRYRRQDEIGTPYCVTIDFDTVKDRAVTVRDRDSMAQERVPLAEVLAYLQNKLAE